MADHDKTKTELIQEVEQLKARIAQLEAGQEISPQTEAIERRHNTELEILRQASLGLTASLDLQEILRLITEYALQLVEAMNAHIFTYDGETLTFGTALWAGQQQREPYSNPRKDGLTYNIARSGKAIMVPDMSNHPLYVGTNWQGSILGLPLRVGNRVYGVMSVALPESGGFNEDEVRILELLADQAAIAIQNSQHVAQIEAEIKERTLAEQALRESETRYRSLFENSPIALREEDWSAIKDEFTQIQQSGRIDLKKYFDKYPQKLLDIATQVTLLDINQTTLTLYDAKNKAELGDPARGLLLNYQASDFLIDGAIALLAGQTYYEAEVEHQTVTGKPIHLLMNLVVAPEHQNDWGKILISAVDITKLKQAEEQALILEKERTRANTLYQLIQAITHDLRTPLTSINTSTYLLRNATDEERRTHHLNIIEGQTVHLSNLIDSILSLARLDTLQTLQLQPTDLHQLLDELATRFVTLMNDKNLNFEVTSDLAELIIEVNPAELHMAISEILKNAIQFTPSGGQISLSTHLEQGYAVISIRDNGIGMDEEVRAQAFDRFYRADTARSTKTGGTGLGLALAKKIIELHSGTIEVESQVDVGTTFYIYLPHQ